MLEEEACHLEYLAPEHQEPTKDLLTPGQGTRDEFIHAFLKRAANHDKDVNIVTTEFTCKDVQELEKRQTVRAIAKTNQGGTRFGCQKQLHGFWIASRASRTS